MTATPRRRRERLLAMLDARITVDQARRLERAAEETGLTVSELVRAMIDLYAPPEASR